MDEIGDATNINSYYDKLKGLAEEHADNAENILEIAKIFKHSKAYQLNVLLTYSNLVMLIIDVVTVALMAISWAVGLALAAPTGGASVAVAAGVSALVGPALAFMSGSKMLFAQIGLVIGELGAEAAADAVYYDAVENYILSIAKVHISQATRQGSAEMAEIREDLTDEEKSEFYKSLTEKSSEEPAEPSGPSQYVQDLQKALSGGGSAQPASPAPDPSQYVQDLQKALSGI